MPVDKFGRMSDTKTKDTGVSLTYINNNYVRSDGGTPLSGSLDMRGNTIYNTADPVNPQDVVTKVYVDNTKGSGVIGRKVGNAVNIKENLDFLGKQKIKNLPDPIDGKDAVSKEYVDKLASNNPFKLVDKKYQSKDDLDLKGGKIKNLCSPFEDGDAVNKGYVDTSSVAFLKVDQGKYGAKADIDMDKIYTVLNVKTPIDDNHITDKKYVDEKVNLNSAFTFRNDVYYAKGDIYLRKNKLGGLREPLQDGEASTKKYVDNLVANHFVDENDNIAFGRAVDMEGNKIFSLPEPEQDNEPATKKYVDDLQTQYIDKRGNVKFDRNINVGNSRIFALKDPKKDYEATNKKYVDDSITKRLQEEKDKFLPQDPATKQYVDEAIKGIAGGDLLVSKEGVFIKANGHYRATAPLDIDNHKMENLREPLEDGDAVNKKYVDGIVENLTLKQGLVRENGGFTLVDSYINMSFNNIRNVGYPQHNEDAVPRSFVDNIVKTTLGQVQNQFKQLNQLVSVSASCHEHLKYGDYPFTFGGPIINRRIYNLDKFNGFLVPVDGFIKHFSIYSTGLVLNVSPNTTPTDFLKETGPKTLNELYGKKDNPTKVFSLVKIGNIATEEEKEIIGSVFITLTTKLIDDDKYKYIGAPQIEFRPNPKYLNKEENFICSVKQGDIINIMCEYTETIIPGDESYINEKGELIAFPYDFHREKSNNKYYLHLATLTFLFKEMSFPDIAILDPLEDN